MKIFEKFWYGNIEPTEYNTSTPKEYKKLLELICRNEEKLNATITDEQKELFDKYADCVRDIRPPRIAYCSKAVLSSVHE